MKHLLIALSVVLTMAACKNEKSDSRNIDLLADSTAYNNDMYSDTSNMYKAEEELQPAVPVKSVTTHTSSTTTAPRSTTKTSSSTSTSSSNQGTQTTQTTTTKEGWSSAAKGAVIGAGAGAIGGAVISKKKPVQGAVIGGAVGAAGGYIIGKDIDKRNGR